MGYVRTAGMSTAARRARRRAALVISTLLAGLLIVFALSLAVMQGWITFPGGEESEPDEVAVTTEAPSGMEVAPEDMIINVYNSTTTSGLASRAAEALTTRGFVVDAVGNSDAEIAERAEIIFGLEGQAEARTLRYALGGGIPLRLDEAREGSSLDLILGDAWEELPTAEDAESEGEG